MGVHSTRTVGRAEARAAIKRKFESMSDEQLAQTLYIIFGDEHMWNFRVQPGEGEDDHRLRLISDDNGWDE